MNSYEAKQERRRERLEAAVERAERLSAAMIGSARKMAEAIPFGQPILIGHHSEKRDRNYRAKIERRYSRGFELMNKAAKLRGILAGVGTAGISSDDPEAVVKLKEELAGLEQKQRLMKLANALIRREKKNGPPAQLAGLMALLKVSEGAAAKLLEPDCCGRIGFPDYSTKNNGANIRRIEARIATLTRERAAAAPLERELEGGITWREDPDENRLMLIFPGKPPEATRSILKANGFRWSPTNGAWQRQLNNAARQSAEWAMRQILGKPTASAGAEVAAMIDPGGTLQRAGLLKVEA